MVVGFDFGWVHACTGVASALDTFVLVIHKSFNYIHFKSFAHKSSSLIYIYRVSQKLVGKRLVLYLCRVLYLRAVALQIAYCTFLFKDSVVKI